MSAASRALVSLLSLSLLSRAATFIFNQALLARVSPAAFGLASITLDVGRETALGLVREGLRGAVVRSRPLSANSRPPAILRRLPAQLLLPALLLFTVLVGPLLYSTPSGLSGSSTARAFAIYLCSIIFEMLAEPAHLLSLRSWEAYTPARVRVEGFAFGVRSAVTLAAASFGHASMREGVVPFALGQAVYGLVLLQGLNWAVASPLEAASIRARTPDEVAKEKREQDAEELEIVRITKAMTVQTVVKQFLGEADKFAAAFLCTPEEQGGYAIALNYGSLVARLLFQPIEASSRLFFSSSSAVAAGAYLSLLLSFYLHLSLALLVFSGPYIPTLLPLLLGGKGKKAGTVLARYLSVYVPAMALNGAAEAFFAASASDAELRGSGVGSLLAGSAVFALSLFTGRLVRSGKEGAGTETLLIVASALAVLPRLYVNSAFVHRRLGASSPLSQKSSYPSIVVLGLTVAAGWTVRATAGLGLVKHVALGAAVGLGWMGAVAAAEWRRVKQKISQLKADNKGDKAE